MGDTSKSSILMGFSITNHPFGVYTFLRKPPYIKKQLPFELTCWAQATLPAPVLGGVITSRHPYDAAIASVEWQARDTRSSEDLGVWFKGSNVWLSSSASVEVDPQGLLACWWFGTFFLFLHILGIIIPTDFRIFQRVETTNQLAIGVFLHKKHAAVTPTIMGIAARSRIVKREGSGQAIKGI